MFARQEEHQFIDQAGKKVGQTASIVYLVSVDPLTGAPRSKGIPVGTYNTTPDDAIGIAKKFFPYVMTIEGGNNPKLNSKITTQYTNQMLETDSVADWKARPNKSSVRYAVVVKSEWEWAEDVIAPRELYQYVLNADTNELARLSKVLQKGEMYAGHYAARSKDRRLPNIAIWSSPEHFNEGRWIETCFNRHKLQDHETNMRIMHTYALAFSPKYAKFFEEQTESNPDFAVMTQEIRNMILAPFYGFPSNSMFGGPHSIAGGTTSFAVEAFSSWESSHKDGWQYNPTLTEGNSAPKNTDDTANFSIERMFPPHLQKVILSPAPSAHPHFPNDSRLIDYRV